MNFKLKDPGSAITHFIGLMLALVFAIPLLRKVISYQNTTAMLAIIIFITSMVLLYSASTVYHSLDISEKINRRLRKLDHIMISVLIAGTYTPICLIVLKGSTGNILLALIWGFALIGILIKAFWITCPKWFSSLLYVAMGWLCVLAFKPLLSSLPKGAFALLLGGGITYTVGAVIYALKLPIFDSRHKNFGSHEIFHLFVMGGSLCHFLLMYLFVAPMIAS